MTTIDPQTHSRRDGPDDRDPAGAARRSDAPRRSGASRRAAWWRTLADWLDRPMASFHLILAVFALMLGFGLLMVLSSSATRAFRRSDSAFSVFTNQALFAAIGLIGFFVVTRMSLRLIRALSTTALIVSLALLVAVLIPGIGSQWNGAQSWITLGSGIQFQPSEVAKLGLLLWAAHVLASVRSPYRRLKSLLIPVLPVFLLMVGLVMLQPDLGTTVTLAVVLFAVLFFAGAQLWLFGVVAGVGLVGMAYLATSAGYRMVRVTAWLHPHQVDPKFTYQAFQGLYALGSGGLFGTGLGQSKMKWGRLPNADSDYIFAIIGEELGLVGTLTVVVLFALLAYTGLRIARRNTDPFIKIAAAGGTVWLVGQAAINIGYVTGLLPVTGIPLPMFSAGGTSLVITMIVFGLLANFARREPAAMAALGAGRPRGLAGFLGIGGSQGPRRVSRSAQRASRSAQRRREKVQRQRNRAREVSARAPAAKPSSRRSSPRTGSSIPRRNSSVAASSPGAASSPRAAPPRRTASMPRKTKRYPVRRALGFPTPTEARQAVRQRSSTPQRTSTGRPRRAGRTMRP